MPTATLITNHDVI